MLQLETLESRCLLSVVITDSLNAAADNLLDYVPLAIGETSAPQSVTITNTGTTDITITDWSLATEADFQLLNRNLPDNTGDNIVLQPNKTFSIWTQFFPQDFTHGGLANLEDRLAIHIAGESAINITLTGTTDGPDLQIDDIGVDISSFNLNSYTEGQGPNPWNFTLTYTGDRLNSITSIAFQNAAQTNFALVGAVPGTLFTNDNLIFSVPIPANSAADPADVLVISTTSGPFEFPLTVTGVLDNTIDLGQVRVGQSLSETFTLVNRGNAELILKEVSAAESTFAIIPLVDATHPLTLQVGQSAQFTLTFTPDQAEDSSNTIIIGSNDGLGNHTIAVAAFGIAPVLTIHESLGQPDDNTLPFGFQPVGVPDEVQIQLANDGNDTLTITQITNTLPTAFQSFTNDPLVLAPGENLDLFVRFLAPQPGDFADTLTITSTGGTSLISLNANAAFPQLQIRQSDGATSSDLTVDLDPVVVDNAHLTGSTPDWLFIRNSGQVELDINSITFAGPGFTGAALTPALLLPGQNLRVDLLFAADSLAPGNYTGSLTIDSSAPQQTLVTLNSGVFTPEIQLPQTTFNFTTVDIGQDATLPLQLTNTGSADLIIDNWTSTDDQFQLDWPAGRQLIIAPQQSAALNVIYQPNQVDDSAAAQITLSSNDLDEPQTLLNLSGSSNGRPIPLLPNQSFGFLDADGDIVRVTVSGGSPTLYLDNGQLSGGDIALLFLQNTSADTRVTITTSGATSLERLQAEGNLSSISAPNTNIQQEIDINGSLDRLTVGNIADQAVIDIDGWGPIPLIISTGHIGNNVTFDLKNFLSSFQAKSFQGGSLQAARIGTIFISQGDLAADISTYEADIQQVIAQNQISGNLDAARGVGTVLSLTNDISGQITARNGDVNLLVANNITGGVLAADDINIILSRNTLSGNFRADQINTLIARNVNNALISAADRIGLLNASNITDSHILAGYDIGLDGLVGSADDDLSGGSINQLFFSGRFENSHLAVGVSPIHSPLNFLTGPDGSNSSHLASTARVFGGTVTRDNNGLPFGLYYDASAPSRLTTNLLPPSDDFLILSQVD